MTELRGSGRTTRMLHKARAYQEEHGQVIILVHDANMIRYCRGIVPQLKSSAFKTPKQVRDWCLHGYDQPLFIDHTFWEQASDDTMDAVYEYIGLYRKKHNVIEAYYT